MNKLQKIVIVAGYLLLLNGGLVLGQVVQRMDIGLNRMYTDSIVVQNTDTLIYNINWNQVQMFAVLDGDTTGVTQLTVTLGTTEGGTDYAESVRLLL